MSAGATHTTDGGVRGRVLHVAAQPFPSPQGTQAVIARMLETLQRAGRDHQLLCYPYADEGLALEPYTFPIHRAGDFAKFRSLRSGPHPRKLIADAELALAVRRAVAQLKPVLVVAHHVEAAMATFACERRVFFAHTALGAELPTYSDQKARVVRSAIGRAGVMLDAALVRRAHAVATVSPVLVGQLQRLVPEHADKVRCVLPPWSVQHKPSPDDHDARKRALHSLGLKHDAYALLYTGNLDGYQGIAELVRAVAIAQAMLPKLVLLVATASDPEPLLREAERAGVRNRIAVRALRGESERVLLHAAAEVAIVPRVAPGGLPIKLLDALSRGVPCVVTPSACAGLPIESCVVLAERDDGEALAAALLSLTASPERRDELAICGARYIEEQHSEATFIQSFDDVMQIALRA